MIKKVTDMRMVEKLFAGWQQSLIWSCMQNVMGNIYVQDSEYPQSAVAILGGFHFLAGKPEKELLLYRPEDAINEAVIMVPQNEIWERLIEDCYGTKAVCAMRYILKNEMHTFDERKLQEIVDSLPPSYTLHLIEENLYNYCITNGWSYHLVSQYPDYETYNKWGIGVMVMNNGEPISGASSFTSYNGGIEVEVDTKDTYRRKGLASVCGAKLILECLKRKIYPNWDAHNIWSVALAEKLGYYFDHEYVVYEIEE